MIIVIPLGGFGRRFRECGYTRPKALVNVFGRSIIWHLISNLNINHHHTVIIPYNKEYKPYNFESLLRKNFPDINFKFIVLEQDSRGAAESIRIALSRISKTLLNSPVLCLDSDNFYTYDIIKEWNGENKIFTFSDLGDSPIYSYVKLNSENDTILEIREKDKISQSACCGAYGFNSAKVLLDYIQKIITADKRVKGEYYTSVVISEMINEGINFKNSEVEKGKYICLGTPLLLKMFYNNFPRRGSINSNEKIKPLRICFDLDNTLVSYPQIPGDYSSVLPLENNINLLRYLKTFGNTIIIYTARRMKTHDGNVGKIYADVGRLTIDTLEKFNIPYDELYFGKPYAHFYIDDLAVNAFSNIQKEIGYYNDFIEPRKFHSIEVKNVSVIKKSGSVSSLSGEIFYYKNIPCEIKDLFPVFFCDDVNQSKNIASFEIEKIEGITVSQLFVSELLKENTLRHIFESINRIQKCSIESINESINEINIYANYSNKLRHRYNNNRSIYDEYPESNRIFNELISFLDDYERDNMGDIGVIHGDSVFTNILINKYDKIKFIDMRGKLDDTLSILGDIHYDWAKIYQSLVGYDAILLECSNLSNKYTTEMINVFKEWYITNYSLKRFNWLKIITKSLIFSLIPIHFPENREKCIRYYGLLKSPYLT